MGKLTLALLSGGVSSEREVSIQSGEQVYEALDKDKYNIIRYDPKTDLKRLVVDASRIDAALIILHGPYGEDGTVQGLLDLLEIPYQGSGVLGSAVAMNKVVSKQLYEKAEIPVPPYLFLQRRDDFEVDFCVNQLGLPVVVKPVECGSSVGMSIVKAAGDLNDAVEKAFSYDETILMETYIQGLELTAGVIGNNDLEALPVIEIIPDQQHEFFDYEAKYTAGVTQEICPARIEAELTARIQNYAIQAHRVLFCKGYSRTDMILKDDEVFVLETNTIPGMTSNSLLPRSAKAAGMSFSRLLDRLIDLSLEGRDRKQ